MPGGQPRVFYVRKAIIFLLLTLILAAGSFVYQYRYLRPSDDYYWLMFIANNFIDPDLGSSLYQRYSDYLRGPGYGLDAVSRADVRQSLDDNYLLQGLFFVPFMPVASALPLSIEAKTVLVMFGGFIAMYVVTSALLLLALWRFKDATLAFSVILAITLIYFVDFAPRPTVYPYLHPGVLGVDLLEQVRHFLARLFHPGPKYVLFNFAPKDRLTVLVTALLLLRWSGRHRTFYLLFPILFLVHREYSGLLLILFVTIDLLIRPRLVLGTWVGPFAGVVMSAFIVTSALGERVEVSGWLALVPLALSIAAVIAFRLFHGLAGRPGWLLAWQEAVVSRWQPPIQDLAPFAIIWLALLPMTYLLYVLTGDPRSETETNLNNFMWLWIPTRYLGLFAPAILAVAIWSLLRWLRVEVRWQSASSAAPPGSLLPGRAAWRYAVATLLAAMIIVPAGDYAWRQQQDPWTIAVQKTQRVEAMMHQPASPANWHPDEVRIYYAMFTTLLTGSDRLQGLGVP